MDEGQLAITKWIPKKVFYTQTGRKLVLPADPYSLEHYLKKGFTFNPPANPLPEKVIESTIDNGLSNIQTPIKEEPKVKRKWHRKRKYQRKNREVEE